MGTVRSFATAIVIAVLAATVGGQAAHAADPGVGTATSDFTLLGVDLLDITSLNVVKDTSTSTIDPAVGTPEAAVSMVPLSATGPIKPLTDPLPTFEARSTGAATDSTGETITLPAELAAVASGKIVPASLKAAVADGTANASGTNQLVELAIAGVLFNLDSAGNALETKAGTDKSVSTRSTTLDSLAALNLGALLASLGVPISALPLSTVLDLVEQLSLTVSGAVGGAVRDLADDYLTAIGEVEALLDPLDEDDTVIGDTLDGLDGITGGTGDPLDGLVGSTDSVTDALAAIGFDLDGYDLTDPASVADLLDDVVAAFLDLLDDAVAALDGASLLSVSDLGVTLGATAADTVAASSATADATLGSLTVAGQSIPVPSLTGTAEEIEATIASTVASANAALKDTLSLVGVTGVDLGDLIKVSLLDRDTSVGEAGGYVESLASLTVLTITITPPDLVALVGGLTAGTGIDDVASDLGGTIETALAGTAAGQALNGAVGVTALSNGATARVLGFTATADFTTTSGGGGGGESPRTGSETTLMLMLATVALAMGFGSRRWVRLARQTNR